MLSSHLKVSNVSSNPLALKLCRSRNRNSWNSLIAIWQSFVPPMSGQCCDMLCLIELCQSNCMSSLSHPCLAWLCQAALSPGVTKLTGAMTPIVIKFRCSPLLDLFPQRISSVWGSRWFGSSMVKKCTGNSLWSRPVVAWPAGSTGDGTVSYTSSQNGNGGSSIKMKSRVCIESRMCSGNTPCDRSVEKHLTRLENSHKHI